MYSLLNLLEEQGPLSPGDAVAHLHAPRYKVLAAFQCLEELGLIAPLYKKGTYKIYQLTHAGRLLKEKALESSVQEVIQKALLDYSEGEATDLASGEAVA